MIVGMYFFGFVSVIGFLCEFLITILSIYGIKHSWDGVKLEILGMKHLLIGFSFMIVSQVLLFYFSKPFYIFVPSVFSLSVHTASDSMVVGPQSELALPLISFGVSLIFISLGLIKMADEFFQIKNTYYYRTTVANEKRKNNDYNNTMLEGG